MKVIINTIMYLIIVATAITMKSAIMLLIISFVILLGLISEKED
jgi:hypothetical protein